MECWSDGSGETQYSLLMRLCRNEFNPENVMLSNAKHLAFSGCCGGEILRLRLRMTVSHSLH